MSEPHSPIEGFLDSLIYAPLGLVTDARTVVPQLAERGRLQVANAKMMGRFAVQMGSVEAAKRMGGLEHYLREAFMGFGFLPPEVADDTESTDARPEPVAVVPTVTSTPARKAAPKSSAGTRKAAAKPKARAAAKPVAMPAADDLAIPGYDSLAASQVVSRLAGLRPAELSAVQRYELHHRGRKTILGRISQLQAS